VKRLRLLAIVTALAVVAAGCGRKNEDRDEALAAVRGSATLPRAFEITETIGEQDVVVSGAIGDDFRYRARVSVDGRPLYEQIVSDDALAIRVLDRDRLAAALGVGLSPTGSTEADTALREGRWVVDPTGAPPITASVRRGGPVAGRDPVAQAIAYYGYVERLIGQVFVARYDEESIDYKPSEDPWAADAPDSESGIDRYDLIRPPLPRPADQQGGSATRNLPGEQHLRKLSVYVRGNRAFEIRERIQFDERLDDAIEYLETQLKEANLPEAFLKEFREGIASASEAEKAEGVLFALNAARETAGDDPIRLREVRAQFTGFGKKNEIILPAGAVEGELDAFFPEIVEDDEGGSVPGLGQSLTTSTTVAGATGGDGSTTTTSPGGATSTTVAP
jgi:hypothetical protein